MTLLPAQLPRVVTVGPQGLDNDRSVFVERFKVMHLEQRLKHQGLPPANCRVQNIYARSAAGMLRGPAHQLLALAHRKLMDVVKSRAFDEGADIRPGSARFCQRVGAAAKAENRRKLWIPPTRADGLSVLEDETRFCYGSMEVCARDCGRASRSDDTEIGIEWPLPAEQDTVSLGLVQADHLANTHG